MRKVFSEILTMHTDSLMKGLCDYAYMTYIKGRAEVGIGDAVPNFDCAAISRKAMAEVVAQLLIDAIASINGNAGYDFHQRLMIPRVPTAKYKAWRESGNCGMFTIEEMFDAHCRELPASELVIGAMKWYTTRFVNEIYNLFGGDDQIGWEGTAVIFTQRDMLVQQILDDRVCLALLEQGDYEFAAEAEDITDLRDELFQWPFSFVMQDDIRALQESIPTYILPAEDQDSEEKLGVELYVLKPGVIDKIKKL